MGRTKKHRRTHALKAQTSGPNNGQNHNVGRQIAPVVPTRPTNPFEGQGPTRPPKVGPQESETHLTKPRRSTAGDGPSRRTAWTNQPKA